MKYKIGLSEIIFALFSFAVLVAVAMAVKINSEDSVTIDYDAKKTNQIEVKKIKFDGQKQEEADKEIVEMIAKTVWGEARDLETTEQAAVIWCILNRVDNDNFPESIAEVITQKNQFEGYNVSNPIMEDIVELVRDVLARWKFEEIAVGAVGRVLPKEYMWFYGNGKENFFRDSFNGGTTWLWTLDSPYKVG